MNYRKYQHIEKYGTTDVKHIDIGDCYVFPKIDGTNGLIWLDDYGTIRAGGRTRELTLEADNRGFYEWVLKQENIINYLKENPRHILYGEWLVRHTISTYNDDAWNSFYVFDVLDNNTYIHYETYKKQLDKFGIQYITPIATFTNGSQDDFTEQLDKNVFLLKDGNVGEGIVIKNYDYRNHRGNQIWAKIITSEFKAQHKGKEYVAKEISTKSAAERIAQEYTTTALCEKEYAKIVNEVEWSSKLEPRLLNTIYYCIVKEECWNFVKKYKNPAIDFAKLQYYVFETVKERLPKIFLS